MSGDPYGHLLDGSRTIHLVGIGGSGINAMGVVLAEMGHQVSGSDLRESLGVLRLRAMGVDVNVGHAAANVEGASLVAHSTAVAPSNAELRRAAELGIPVVTRAQLLRAICDRKRTVAVAGTHGKTTTSSMLSMCLGAASLHPSFVVGGDLNDIGGGAVWDDDGDLFVVEADESDGTFTELGATTTVVTSVEPDHLDYYGSEANLRLAFERFVGPPSQLAVLCADDSGAAQLAEAASGRCVTYGLDPAADYTVANPASTGEGVTFELVGPSGLLGDVHLPLAGLHNAQNAAAAAATAIELGAEPTEVIGALERFAGVARRFELRGQSAGITFIDDYAHLPTEIAAAVAAARDGLQQGSWQRVVVVFQPHRFTRTKALWRTFAGAFDGADVVVLTGIYPAGEVAQPGITGELVHRAVAASHPNVSYTEDRADLAAEVGRLLRPGDLCLTLGAGDITSLPDELMTQLRGDLNPAT